MSSEILMDALIAATGVMLVGWLASLAIRRAPAALRNSVWRAALAGAWLAPLVVMVGALLPVQPRELALPVLPPTPPLAVASPAAGSSAVRAAAPTLSAPREPAQTGRHLPLTTLLCGLWCMGSGLALVLLARDVLAARRLAQGTGGAAAPALQERIAYWAQQMALRELPQAFGCEAVSVPGVVGWRRPRLVLPAGAGAEGPPQDAALVHELAHVRRGDLAAQAAARLTRALWWWHPLVWLAARELHNTAEQACDDWVIALTGQRRGYAEVLVHWAEGAQAAGALGCVSRGRALVARVRRILEGKQMPMVRLSSRTRGALAVGALAVIVAVGAVRVRAVAYGQAPEQGPPAEFRLEFYLADLVEEENVAAPEGHRLFEHEGRRYLAEGEPVATDRDIAYTRMRETSHEEAGEQVWVPVVLFELTQEAKARFRQVTGENVGRPLLIVLNGEVVMAPIIRSAIPGAGVMVGMTEEQLRVMAGHWKWDQPPEPAEGTGTIQVTARFADGSRPDHADCTITTHSQSQRMEDADWAEFLPVRPKVVGGGGDWTIYNVQPGQWGVQLSGRDFPDTERQVVPLAQPGEQATVHFALTPGGTVTGRVASAETGEPVENATVSWTLGRFRTDLTDAQGRYLIEHVSAGRGRATAVAEGCVPTQTPDFAVVEGETAAAPQIRLARGGWIEGKVVVPKELAERAWLRVEPVAEGAVPAGAVLGGCRVEEDGGFRAGPLPAGSYRLRVEVATGASKLRDDRWGGESGSVRVEVGQATEGVVIEVRRADQG